MALLVTSPVQSDTVIKHWILLFVLFVNHYVGIVRTFLKLVLIAIFHCYYLKIQQLTFLVSLNALSIIILIEQQMILAIFVTYHVKIVLLCLPIVLLVILELIFITFNVLIHVPLSIMGMTQLLHASLAINTVLRVRFHQPTAVSAIPQVPGFRISNFLTPALQTVAMDSSLTPTTISDPIYACLVISNVSHVPSTPLTVSLAIPRTTCLTTLVVQHVLFLNISLTTPRGNVCLAHLTA